MGVQWRNGHEIPLRYHRQAFALQKLNTSIDSVMRFRQAYKIVCPDIKKNEEADLTRTSMMRIVSLKQKKAGFCITYIWSQFLVVFCIVLETERH